MLPLSLSNKIQHTVSAVQVINIELLPGGGVFSSLPAWVLTSLPAVRAEAAAPPCVSPNSFLSQPTYE